MTEYKEFKVGDLITTSWKGFFELIEITPRYELKEYPYSTEHFFNGALQVAPVFLVKQKYRDNGKPFNGKELKECHSDNCGLAKTHIEKQIKISEEETRRLKIIYNSLQPPHKIS